MLGVLSLLSIVFSMVWVLMMRLENAFDSLTQMWMPFLAGTTLALLMITVIDLLRFNLTRNLGGFPWAESCFKPLGSPVCWRSTSTSEAG
ncbi:MAG: hypothetical protein MZV64_19445 [Ignavibacteriales bacterium]|nr:hypothetical protein [Ignavibacteriales bacterium]